MPAVICPFVDGRLATQYSRVIIKYCVLHVEYNCGEMADSKDKIERICQPNSQQQRNAIPTRSAQLISVFMDWCLVQGSASCRDPPLTLSL